VVSFINNHGLCFAKFRSESNVALIMPGETRFGTNFLMLERLVAAKDSVKATVKSDDWGVVYRTKDKDGRKESR
jgi:hypothetical protein